jgi:hypothetical protein
VTLATATCRPETVAVPASRDVRDAFVELSVPAERTGAVRVDANVAGPATERLPDMEVGPVTSSRPFNERLPDTSAPPVRDEKPVAISDVALRLPVTEAIAAVSDVTVAPVAVRDGVVTEVIDAGPVTVRLPKMEVVLATTSGPPTDRLEACTPPVRDENPVAFRADAVSVAVTFATAAVRVVIVADVTVRPFVTRDGVTTEVVNEAGPATVRDPLVLTSPPTSRAWAGAVLIPSCPREFMVRPATPKLAVPPAVLVPRDGRMSRLPLSFIT